MRSFKSRLARILFLNAFTLVMLSNYAVAKEKLTGEGTIVRSEILNLQDPFGGDVGDLSCLLDPESCEEDNDTWLEIWSDTEKRLEDPEIGTTKSSEILYTYDVHFLNGDCSNEAKIRLNWLKVKKYINGNLIHVIEFNENDIVSELLDEESSTLDRGHGTFTLNFKDVLSDLIPENVPVLFMLSTSAEVRQGNDCDFSETERVITKDWIDPIKPFNLSFSGAFRDPSSGKLVWLVAADDVIYAPQTYGMQCYAFYDEANDWEIDGDERITRTGYAAYTINNSTDIRSLRVESSQTISEGQAKLLNRVSCWITDAAYNRAENYKLEPVTVWGSYGSGNGQFKNPSAIAVDSSRHVFVVDRNNYRIQEFYDSGVYIHKFGSQGNGNGQFGDPRGIATSGGYVYVVDFWFARVQKFTQSGGFVKSWAPWAPNAIARTKTGSIFVSDFSFGGDIIRKYTDDGDYQYWFSSEENDFVAALAVDEQDNVYAHDCGRIYKYSSSGYQLRVWDAPFCNGAALATKGSDFVYAASSYASFVSKYTTDGDFVVDLPINVIDGIEIGGMTIDSSENIFITDMANDRVLKLRETSFYLFNP